MENVPNIRRQPAQQNQALKANANTPEVQAPKKLLSLEEKIKNLCETLVTLRAGYNENQAWSYEQIIVLTAQLEILVQQRDGEASE